MEEVAWEHVTWDQGELEGVFPVFSLLGNPFIDMDLRNACTCIESTLLYSCTFTQTCVF